VGEGAFGSAARVQAPVRERAVFACALTYRERVLCVRVCRARACVCALVRAQGLAAGWALPPRSKQTMKARKVGVF